MKKFNKQLILAFYILVFTSTANASQLKHSVYIWQRNWTSGIKESINKISAYTNDYSVLSGNMSYKSGKISIAVVNIDWKAFPKECNVTLAFRLNTQVRNLFKEGKFDKAINAFVRLINKQEKKAWRREVSIAGLQFDYDCPTSKLNDYFQFLVKIKERFPQYKISITSLPTWLKSKDFKKLVQLTDYYVLQLHTFEAPKSIENKRNIFLYERALDYVKMAEKLRRPFSIALPTYSYEVAFDTKDKFIGLRAETAPIIWGKGAKIFIENTSPEEILDFINKLNRFNLSHFQSIVWFRLPIGRDELNWDVKTLMAVMEGRLPIKKIGSEVVKTDKGLYEVYLINEGEENLNNDIEVNIQWDDTAKFFYDFVSSFTGRYSNSSSGIIAEGPAPKVNQRVVVGWFRDVNKTNIGVMPWVEEVIVNE